MCAGTNRREFAPVSRSQFLSTEASGESQIQGIRARIFRARCAFLAKVTREIKVAASLAGLEKASQ